MLLNMLESMGIVAGYAGIAGNADNIKQQAGNPACCICKVLLPTCVSSSLL
jgi:hypothetical protein